MSYFYIFPTEQAAIDCIGFINSQNYFPITGNKGGTSSATSQKTESWTNAPTELIGGEWAVPQIPSGILIYLDVPDDFIAEFITNYGQDIRYISEDDIKTYFTGG